MYSLQIQVPLAAVTSASLSNDIGLPFLVCVTRMVFPQLLPCLATFLFTLRAHAASSYPQYDVQLLPSVTSARH